MTDTTAPSAFAPAEPALRAYTPLPKQKMEPVRAYKAFRRLVADKEDTTQVFEIMQALNGRSTWAGYQKLLSTVEGGRLAYRRLELNTLLNDPMVLDGFAPGTVGAAYRDFMRAENLSAEGLAEESRKAAARRGAPIELDHPVAWYGRRIRDTHDLWHTLTGYGRDALGELCLVAFSYAQTRSLGWAFIAVGGCLRALSVKGGWFAVKAVWQAYRHGRAAAWLPGEDFERILNEPVEAARRRLKIAAPSLYLAIPAHIRDQAPNMG
jgi:ubiquinone biosynthesis protein COQ4